MCTQKVGKAEETRWDASAHTIGRVVGARTVGKVGSACTVSGVSRASTDGPGGGSHTSVASAMCAQSAGMAVCTFGMVAHA